MSPVPTTLKGKEFEQLLMDAADRERRAKRMTMGRYGTNGVTIKDDSDPSGKRTKTVLIPSLPDFEGVLYDGRQFIIEAKHCQQTAFDMRKESIKPKQVEHMLERSAFGVPCFLVIHFAERRGQNFFYPAITVAIPVNNSRRAWQDYVDAYAIARRLKQKVKPQGSITRDIAQEWGQLVPWRIPKGCRKALPDLMSFLVPDSTETPAPDSEQPTLF
ncbi:Holliday junction resolvase RecU [Luteolibacter yonseiensis]|uniref:Holliday junction resolvase RecU n=1 Tax=Luteolibacter yonseiensis TaxID=1144680 RepID=A0A934R5T2_9BACT|nr:Holliday junction resolvase RecU [Luteolibacter yonseiensis]MBK1817512.1 Holliday junction resolvase RecU [Luteolibacter yonseiensis]